MAKVTHSLVCHHTPHSLVRPYVTAQNACGRQTDGFSHQIQHQRTSQMSQIHSLAINPFENSVYTFWPTENARTAYCPSGRGSVPPAVVQGSVRVCACGMGIVERWQGMVCVWVRVCACTTIRAKCQKPPYSRSSERKKAR